MGRFERRFPAQTPCATTTADLLSTIRETEKELSDDDTEGKSSPDVVDEFSPRAFA